MELNVRQMHSVLADFQIVSEACLEGNDLSYSSKYVTWGAPQRPYRLTHSLGT